LIDPIRTIISLRYARFNIFGYLCFISEYILRGPGYGSAVIPADTEPGDGVTERVLAGIGGMGDANAGTGGDHAATGAGTPGTGGGPAGPGGMGVVNAGTGAGHTATRAGTAGTGGGPAGPGGMGVANAGTGAGPAGTGPAATASRVLGPPPASVDFVSQVWNNFGATVLPLCGGVAQEAVRTNRDPLEIGEHDSVLIQKDIIASTIRKFFIPYII